jgi:RNA polymerase sigma-70 factor (sigma-E family)
VVPTAAGATLFGIHVCVQATRGTLLRLLCVGVDTLGLTNQPDILVIGHGSAVLTYTGEDARSRDVSASQAVTALYREHATGLIRLAVVMLGDRPTAEDVVQEAFCGLYRRWAHLSDPAKSLPYVRSAVLNGCRTVIRRRSRHNGRLAAEPAAASAEHDALLGEEHRAVIQGVRKLPPRQREALVLRYFMDLDVAEIAQSMGISPGTVKSTLSRGIAALGLMLGDDR